MGSVKKCKNCKIQFNNRQNECNKIYCTICGAELEEIGEVVGVNTTTVDPDPADTIGETVATKIANLVSNDVTDVFSDEVVEDEFVNEDFTVNERALNNVLAVDNLGYLHFIEPKEDEDTTINRALIYIKDKIYKVVPLRYMETTVGRISSSSRPDVDLTDIDMEKRISRNHILFYKENNEDYIRNTSSSKSVHVNMEALENDQSRLLHDEDLIILDSFLVIKYKRQN